MTLSAGRLLAVAAMAVSTLVAGCGESPPSRGDVLGDLADDAIVPAYEDLASDADDLFAAVRAFCADPSSDAQLEVQNAVADTRWSWSYTESVWIGPVMERRSWAVIDWPIAADEIEELIADRSVPLDAETISLRVGADQRGLGAAEYIVGSTGQTDGLAAVLEDPRRCDYLVAVVEAIQQEAALLPTDWSTDFEGEGPWSETLAADGDAGVDGLVNDSLFLLEAIADAELGTALGEMDRPADLEVIVEGPLGLGANDLAAHLAGVRAVLIGVDDASGMRELLGDDLSDRLSEQLDQADAAVAEIDGPLRAAVVNDPAQVSATREAVKTLQVTVATEVVSRLGVTIGFSDADGDTGG